MVPAEKGAESPSVTTWHFYGGYSAGIRSFSPIPLIRRLVVAAGACFTGMPLDSRTDRIEPCSGHRVIRVPHPISARSGHSTPIKISSVERVTSWRHAMRPAGYRHSVQYENLL